MKIFVVEVECLILKKIESNFMKKLEKLKMILNKKIKGMIQ